MPFDHELAAALLLPGETFRPKPYITGWNRVEGRPREEEFERALRAEARDPLWFLARQWQFLELKGDDAGSPIEARLATRHILLDRFATHSGPVQAFPRDAPLEAIVEREPVPFDRVSLIQLHRAFDKALVAEGVVAAADRRTVHDWLRSQFPLAPGQISGIDEEEARQLAALADAHLFDGAAFLADPDFAGRVDADLAAAAPALANPVKAAGAATRRWFGALYLQPGSADDIAWAPAQLEYRFRCATAAGRQQTVLEGNSYTQGRLDWFCADIAQSGEEMLGEEGGEPAPVPREEALSFVPAPVSFGGMPSHRYWEMEDRRVEFGALTAHTTDIGKLLLAEFVLCYGNDWCVMPLEVEVGALVDTLGLVVHDVFGDATLVRAADRGRDEEWRRWAMFGLETRDPDDRAQPRLFVAPTTPKMLESPPIERVVFLRDEMANMCWAVERTLPSAAGFGIDAESHALSLGDPPQPERPPLSGVSARYRLGTHVPLNWRPFVPTKLPGTNRSIRLQRARLPDETRPVLGLIIREPAPYFIDEEAVPRAGRIVTRSFQRTRWIDGRTVIWLGRRSMTGRGEGSSGLAFDVIEEVPNTAANP